MKYKYTLHIKDLGSRKVLLFDLPKEIDLVSAFLYSCIYDEQTASWYLSGIESVITDESNYEEYDGEIYGLKIKSDFTIVYNTLADSFDNVDMEECKIETSELKELIIAWMEELKKFRAQQESEPKTNPQETQTKSQENQSS